MKTRIILVRFLDLVTNAIGTLHLVIKRETEKKLTFKDA